VLCYYLGGGAGITACGYAYSIHGWIGVVTLNASMLLIPFAIGLMEVAVDRHGRSSTIYD
jgi:hypothetical protein